MLDVSARSVKVDYYDETGQETNELIGEATWGAQTFKATSSYTIKAVRLKLGGVAETAGTITVSIRNTAGGFPTGGDLCSGTTDGSILTINTAWIEISLGDGCALEADAVYAIVVCAPSAPWATVWAQADDSNGYADGQACESTDSGVNWVAFSNSDYLFETYTIE